MTQTATRIHQHGGNTYVTYHDTDVVCFDNSWIMLRTDGHFTATTLKRMNQASQQFGLGYRVYQQNKQWFVELPDGNTLAFGNENWVGFSRS